MKLCCKDINDAKDSVSPFKRIIVTDYYDGLKSGIAECVECGSLYDVNMIDWDDLQDVRIFGLSHFTNLRLTDILQLFPSGVTPKWPIWVLIDNEQFGGVLSGIEDLRKSKQEPSLVIATEDLSTHMIHARRAGTPQSIDWFREFNLARKPE